MKPFDVIARAVSNLNNNRTRTALTVLALTVGSISLNLGLALTNGPSQAATELLQGQARTVNVQRYKDPSLSQKLDVNRVQDYDPQRQVSEETGFVFVPEPIGQQEVIDISTVEGVEQVITEYEFSAQFLRFQADVGRRLNLPNIQQYTGQRLRLSGGSGLETIELAPGQIVVNELYARTLDIASESMIGQKVEVALTREDIPGKENVLRQFTVGMVEKEQLFFGSGDNALGADIYINPEDAALFNLDLIELAESSGSDMVWQPEALSIQLDDQVSETSARLAIEKVGDNIQTSSFGDILDEFRSFINAMTYGFIGFSAIVLLAGSFGIINTQLMSVYERTGEIGLLRAIGARAKDIQRMFLVEAALIGFFGALFGAFLALAVQAYVNLRFAERLEDLGGQILVVDALHVLYVICGLTVLAILAGVLPSIRAQKVDPIEALRS